MRLIRKILETDPTNEEAYKAIAFLYEKIKEDEKLRAWIIARANDGRVEPDKRAEAYIVLASKDWDCSFQITDLPTNKITTVTEGKATVSYKKPRSERLRYSSDVREARPRRSGERNQV